MLTQLIESLNENQRLAVEWDTGRLLVLAGPGSGKTHVLTLRIARLIEQSAEEHYRVLALTFTAKAAAEMKTRVDQVIGQRADRTFITTFHSFAADILRQHGSHVGIRPDFVILNQDEDRAAVLADAIAHADDGVVGPGDVRLLPVITFLLENMAEDSDVRSMVRDPSAAEKAKLLYPAYQNELIQGNRLDFPSLLVFAHRLLTTQRAVAEQVRLVYPRLCVDEFQDTNMAQYMLLRAIAGEKPRDLFVVADDDQIIYQWNGASVERLQSLRDDYEMQVLQLPGNYRCPPEVIVLANSLIRNNSGRAPDKLPLVALKAPTGEAVVRVRRFKTADAEVNWIANDLGGRESGARGRSVVLARSRRLVERVAAALGAHGVPASLAIRKFEFNSAPIRWLHSVLRLVDGRGDREQLRRVSKAFFELEGINVPVEDVVAQSATLGGDLLRSWVQEALARGEVSSAARDVLTAGLAQIVDRAEYQAFMKTASDWFESIAQATGSAGNEVFVDYSEEAATWQELVDSVLSRYGTDLPLHAFLNELDLTPKTPPPPPDAVRCLTIHSAKGMEFDHVYLCGLVEEELPSYQSIKKGAESLDMQEERRNCFVAITRTQETLTLTLANEYSGWPRRPSRFLSEMGLAAPPASQA